MFIEMALNIFLDVSCLLVDRLNLSIENNAVTLIKVLLYLTKVILQCMYVIGSPSATVLDRLKFYFILFIMGQ